MRRGSKIIARLDAMLEAAINGSFVETDYDETELSRLESKFRQYLTAREAASEKVEAERCAIKELVTDIFHQTKTPLANILLYTQLLREQCQDPQAVPYIEQICMQTTKLEFLMQALIKISRLESGMVELFPTEEALYPLLLQAVKLAKGRAGAKGITIELAGEKRDIRAVFDFRWTLEAMGNLLDNAVKYSPAGSVVTVSVRAYEMFVRVSVEDMGPGILESEQAQIFDRFYRGKNARQEEGNGVGLYLTRMILQKERGYVKVDSREGCGSCFSIYLQRA